MIHHLATRAADQYHHLYHGHNGHLPELLTELGN